MSEIHALLAEPDRLFGVIVQKSLLAGILVVGLFLLTLLGRNRISPRVRYAIWFLLPIQLLFFVSIPSPWSVKNIGVWAPRPHVETDRLSSAGEMPTLQGAGKMPAVPGEAEGELPFWDPSETEILASEEPLRIETVPLQIGWPASIWLGGILLFGVGCASQIFLLRRDIHAGSVVVDNRVLRIFEDCKHSMKINTWIMLVESSRIRGPFLIGVFRPVIIVPAGLISRLNAEELRHLFLHELAHLKRGDLISGWIMTIMLAIHWFNPLVWIAVRTMNHLREETADAVVVEHLEIEHRFDYGNTLLNLSRQLAKPRFVPGIAGILETRSFLRRRIDMITSPRCWKKIWTLPALVVCGALMLTLLTDAKPQEKASDIPKEAVKKSEKAASAEKIDPKRVPKIVNIFPKNNSKGVDPNIPQIVVLFDIPMSEGFAFAQRSDQTALDGEKDTKPFWTADGKACVMPVKLKPGKTYETMMNFKPFLGFYSADGVPAEELFYTFSTARKAVSEEARQQYANRILTRESNAPEAGPTEPMEATPQKTAAMSPKSTLSPELQKKARNAFKTMVERSELWLLCKTQKAKSWAYHAKIDSTTDKDAEVLEHDISYEQGKRPDWDLMRGTTCSGIVQAVAILADKDPSAVQWTETMFGDDEIKLTFALSQPAGIAYGNGMLGRWYGFFNVGKIERGVIILDAKTMMPKTAYIDNGVGEQFGNYVKFAENTLVPKKIQVKNGKMSFLLEFKIYEPDLWLLEKSTYSVKMDDGSDFGSVVEISDVFVNDAPAKEWTK